MSHTALTLQPIAPAADPEFRALAEAYWRELMPGADTVRDASGRDAYYHAHFDPPGMRVLGAVVAAERIGFVAFTLDTATRAAFVEDFYVRPDRRRHGYGTALVGALNALLDTLDVRQVDLSVRRDTPAALAFWEAQGFRVATYRMRQYRDPATGRAFIGALSSDFEPLAGE